MRDMDSSPAAHSSRPLLIAVAGALAAAGYGALKAAWAAGSSIGVNGTPPWEAGTGAWADLPAAARFFALEGTVILAAIAAALLFALVKPPADARRRRVLRVLAMLGALVMLAPGVTGTLNVLAAAAGIVTDEGEMELWVFGWVYGCFTVLGLALAAMAWLTRGQART